jgi:hypothetical protein
MPSAVLLYSDAFPPNSAKAADARPETAKELAISLRGAFDVAAVLRGFIEIRPILQLESQTRSPSVRKGTKTVF